MVLLKYNKLYNNLLITICIPLKTIFYPPVFGMPGLTTRVQLNTTDKKEPLMMMTRLCHTLTQSISSASMSLKEVTYLWLIMMKYAWRNKLYKFTLYVEGAIQITRPWLSLHLAQTRDRRGLLYLVFLWDPNLGSRLWESLKGVVTGSNSFKLWICKTLPLPPAHPQLSLLPSHRIM